MLNCWNWRLKLSENSKTETSKLFVILPRQYIEDTLSTQGTSLTNTMPNHYVFKACIILQILSVTLAFVGGKQRSIFQRSHHHHHGLTPLFPRCQQQRPIVSMSMDEFPEGNAPEGNMPEGTEAPTKDPSDLFILNCFVSYLLSA